MITERERFWAKVATGDPDVCWAWTASVRRKDGYGQFALAGGGKMLAHRYAWTERNGPIPPGSVVDHTCHRPDGACPGGATCPHRRCVNPAHLALTTIGDNNRRGQNDRMRVVRSGVCRSGRHVLDRDGTYPTQSGGRRCRPCSLETSARNYRRRRDAS